MNKPFGFTEFGPTSPRAERVSLKSFDYALLIQAIKKVYPLAVYWQAWSGPWALNKQLNAKGALSDPWVLNRENLAE